MFKRILTLMLILLMLISVNGVYAYDSPGYQDGVGGCEYNLAARVVHLDFYGSEVTLKWSKGVEYITTEDPLYFYSYTWGKSGYILVNVESHPSDSTMIVETLKWSLKESADPELVQDVIKTYDFIDGGYVLVSEENYPLEPPYGLGLIK